MLSKLECEWNTLRAIDVHFHAKQASTDNYKKVKGLEERDTMEWSTAFERL